MTQSVQQLRSFAPIELRPPASAAARLSVRLRPVPDAPASARRLVRDACQEWQLPAPLADEAATVAGVLVLTSVHQVRSVLRLTVMAAGAGRPGRGTVLIEVEDRGREEATSCLPGPPWAVDSLVRLASDTGSARLPGGRQLWARVGATPGRVLTAVPDPEPGPRR